MPRVSLLLVIGLHQFTDIGAAISEASEEEGREVWLCWASVRRMVKDAIRAADACTAQHHGEIKSAILRQQNFLVILTLKSILGSSKNAIVLPFPFWACQANCHIKMDTRRHNMEPEPLVLSLELCFPRTQRKIRNQPQNWLLSYSQECKQLLLITETDLRSLSGGDDCSVELIHFLFAALFWALIKHSDCNFNSMVVQEQLGYFPYKSDAMFCMQDGCELTQSMLEQNATTV
ncbi:hypothetical protein HPP92_024339 [Vanilla planifolia]|uniref:Uncharacterized protein n=1 Tax=Vanilla planifolia TaxID=51239 RepID=A0A835UB23_VANPL|nr:hypothetical protein HPP92_024339 [Vanilla planifolia]